MKLSLLRRRDERCPVGFWALFLLCIILISSLAVSPCVYALNILKPAKYECTVTLHEASKKFSTPEEVADFMWWCFQYSSDEEKYGNEDLWQSPFETLRSRGGDCEDYAVFAGEVLGRQGYTWWLLILGTGNDSHAVLLYKDPKTRLFRAISNDELIPCDTKGWAKCAKIISPDWDKAYLIPADKVPQYLHLAEEQHYFE